MLSGPVHGPVHGTVYGSGDQALQKYQLEMALVEMPLADWLEICPLGHQSLLRADHGKQQKCKMSLLNLDASVSLSSQGRGIFASGSPFSKVTLPNGQTFFPGQGNNAYVFPGVALGVIACGVRHISEDIFLITAEVSNWLLTNDFKKSVRGTNTYCRCFQEPGLGQCIEWKWHSLSKKPQLFPVSVKAHASVAPTEVQEPQQNSPHSS